MSQTQRQYDFANGNKLQDFHLDDEFNNLVGAHNTLDTDVQGHKDSSDHDERYYTKSQTDEEINKAVVSGSQSKVIETGNVLPTSPTLGQKFFKSDSEQEYIYANGRWILQETDINPLEKEIANINLNLELNGIATSRLKNTGAAFFDGFHSTDYTNRLAQLDLTKTNTTASLAIGATVLPVLSATGFAVGQEVTIYDDVNLERVMISAVDGLNLTVTALTKAYKNQANVARSMCVLDTTLKALKFGAWGYQTTNTVTDASVVASAYDTSGNGGRKLVKLSNGWLVSAVGDNSNGKVMFYVDKQDGNGFVALTRTISLATSVSPLFSISNKGNIVYFIASYATSGVLNYGKFDATTVANTDQSVQQIDSAQSAMGANSLTINEAGTELHAAWASKNSTYPNSFNIRYAKGTINGDGTVSWGAVEQISTNNTTGQDLKNPSIIVNGNGSPVILCDFNNGTTVNNIRCYHKNSGSWSSAIIVYGGNGYTQSSPSAIFVPQSVNGLANGRIWVTWHGKDSTNPSANNLRVSYSDDGGVTWSTMQSLTAEPTKTQEVPSITANKNNVISIVFEGASSESSYRQIRSIKNTSGTWGSITTITDIPTANDSAPSTLFDPSFSINFSEPMFIYKDGQNAKVGFYGTWTIGTETPILVNDIRYKLDTTTDDVVAWVKRDTGLTVSAQVSMVDSGNEVYTNMTQNADVSDEYEFTASATAAKAQNHLKLTMTRALTTDDKKITRLLGGVA
jgi:hypothetical protein